MRCVIAVMLFIAAPILVSVLSTSIATERTDADVGDIYRSQTGLARLAGAAHNLVGPEIQDQ